MIAIDHKNDKFRTVEPFAIAENDAWDTLFIIDGFTGNGIHMDSSGRWHMDFGDDERPCYTERVEGIYGKNKEEWEAAANAKLAKYGLRLGGFCKTLGDEYKLIEEEGFRA